MNIWEPQFVVFILFWIYKSGRLSLYNDRVLRKYTVKSHYRSHLKAIFLLETYLPGCSSPFEDYWTQTVRTRTEVYSRVELIYVCLHSKENESVSQIESRKEERGKENWSVKKRQEWHYKGLSLVTTDETRKHSQISLVMPPKIKTTLILLKALFVRQKIYFYTQSPFNYRTPLTLSKIYVTIQFWKNAKYILIEKYYCMWTIPLEE